MAKTSNPQTSSEALHPFTAVDENGTTQSVYRKSEVDRYLFYYRDAVDARARALQAEITRLQTKIAPITHVYLVHYRTAQRPDGSYLESDFQLSTDARGSRLYQEARERAIAECHEPVVLHSINDLGESVEPVRTYSDVAAREG